MDRLPDELIWLLASFLTDLHDLASLARVNRRLQVLLRDARLVRFNTARFVTILGKDRMFTGIPFRLQQRLNLGRPVESWLLDSVREVKFHPSTDVASVLCKAGPNVRGTLNPPVY